MGGEGKGEWNDGGESSQHFGSTPTPAQYHIFPSLKVYWSAFCPKVQSGPPEIGGWLTLGNMQTPSSQMGPYRLRLSQPLIQSALA